MKETAFFIIFKRLSIKQITQIFLEGEFATLIFQTYFLSLRLATNKPLELSRYHQDQHFFTRDYNIVF